MLREHVLGVAFVVAFFAGTGRAADYTWNASQSNSWKAAGNWTPNRTDPGQNDVMIIAKDQTSTCTYDEDRGFYQTIHDLYIHGRNTVSQADYVLTVTELLTVGSDDFDALAQYIFSDGELNAAGAMNVGHQYSGLFEQSGGVVTVGSDGLRVAAGTLPNLARWGTYSMTDGALTVEGPITIGFVDMQGLFEQEGGDVACKSMQVGGDAGWGEYDMSGGHLTVEDASGTPDLIVGKTTAKGYCGFFLQTGGYVEIKKATGGAHGQLLVGTGSNPGGIYRLAGGAVTANGGIAVGGQTLGNYGRFEWFTGSEQSPNVNVYNESMALGAGGTLALGFDLYIEDMLDGGYFAGGTVNTLTGLSSATLEVTNRATVTQVASPYPDNICAARLNIGDSLEEEAIAVGTYQRAPVAGKYRMLCDGSQPSLQTGAVFIGRYADQEQYSELAIGSVYSSAQAEFTVTGAASYGQLSVSLLFGPGSKFTAPNASSTAKFTFGSPDAKVVIDSAVSAANLPALAKTTMAFDPDNGQSPCWPELEAAGSAFALKQLTIGGTAAGAPVWLEPVNQEDNGEDDGALYAETLDFSFHGTADVGNIDIYYKNGGDWRFLIPGDTDLDGEVDFQDYQILETNFGTTTGMTWEDGDFNGDGGVDFADYQILETHYGQGQGDSAQSPQPLPELRDFDDDGDVDLDDLHTAQALYKEQYAEYDQ